jgi:hypothetical protein
MGILAVVRRSWQQKARSRWAGCFNTLQARKRPVVCGDGVVCRGCRMRKALAALADSRLSPRPTRRPLRCHAGTRAASRKASAKNELLRRALGRAQASTSRCPSGMQAAAGGATGKLAPGLGAPLSFAATNAVCCSCLFGAPAITGTRAGTPGYSNVMPCCRHPQSTAAEQSCRQMVAKHRSNTLAYQDSKTRGLKP